VLVVGSYSFCVRDRTSTHYVKLKEKKSTKASPHQGKWRSISHVLDPKYAKSPM